MKCCVLDPDDKKQGDKIIGGSTAFRTNKTERDYSRYMVLETMEILANAIEIEQANEKPRGHNW